ncbi:hypothetical protein HD806DRAFT_285811 [Xylariaceae sp. AK1471]|nr:hypothetical protein HD806DRAFT_285811 [Xylariaceae sp. AK1471]
MASTKGNYQEESNNMHDEHEHEHGNAAPPPYDEASQAGPSHTQAAAVAAAAATESKRPYDRAHEDAVEARPTVNSPFNFPPAYTASASALGEGHNHYPDLPEVAYPSASAPGNTVPFSPFSPSSASSPSLLLAIPQTAPQPTSPFLPSYNAAILLRHGIPVSTFTSFLSTLSAFLSASVSERALAHVSDVGRSINSVPKKFGKDTVAHMKDVGRSIGESAKRGNILGAGVSALVGTVTVPVGTALRLVDASLRQLPAAVGGGLAKKPLSPRERADAYVAVAQKDWLRSRGLTALLCNTAELVLLEAQCRGSGGSGDDGNEAAVKNLVGLANKTWERGPVAQLAALHREFGFAPLEIAEGQANRDKPLDIGAGTLWLVLTDAASEA